MDLTAGFVLTGGQGSRIGPDKAPLPVDSHTLVERTAQLVRAAAGSAMLIGMPDHYRGLGLPVTADLVHGSGPMGELFTALEISKAEWNLIVAAGMPRLTAEFLKALMVAARASPSACVVPESAAGLHPLCAVYHCRAKAAVAAAIHQKSLKMHDLLRSLEAERWPVADPSPLENVSTPLESGVR